jgi:signal transduction histidine kinase
MQVNESLKKLHDPWIERVVNKLGRSELGRDYLVEELERFFELLLQAVESDDPGWLNPILIDWAASRTETDIKKDEITLSPVLFIIIDELIETAKHLFSTDDTVELVSKLMPILYYSYEQIAKHESLVRISYYSAKLEQVTADLSLLDRTKSDFISVAAHELKTPLTLIEGYSSMLKDLVEPFPKKEEISILLGGIKKGIDRLGEMIKDMIDVSLIDNNMLSLKFQPTWLNQLLTGLEFEFKNILEERNIKLDIKSFSGSKEMMFADTERIQQALVNVLSNAIKYTPNGGKIIVDGRILPGFVEVLVKDNGIGIAEEDQIRIFEKFSALGEVSLHSSSKLNYKGGGPGLGLPIAKGILEAHGGSIWVESEGYNEETLPGSTFHLLIPLREQPPDEQVAKLFSASQTNKNDINSQS